MEVFATSRWAVGNRYASKLVMLPDGSDLFFQGKADPLRTGFFCWRPKIWKVIFLDRFPMISFF